MTQSQDVILSSDAPTTDSSSSWTSYFEAKEWVAYAIFLILGLIFRWTLLDMRPYHHDESLHGMYGRYFYDWPNNNFYKYDPMLHGPMLYNCMRFIYAMFGDSLWAARTPVAIMGSLFMIVPFLFRSFFKKQTVLLLTAAIALSPTLVYWSRFLREDYWVVSGMLICLYGITLAPARLRALLLLLGITIQWCTKENIFVTAAIVAGYLITEGAFFASQKARLRGLLCLLGISLVGFVIWYSIGFTSKVVLASLAVAIVYLLAEAAAVALRSGSNSTSFLSVRALQYVARYPWETTWALVACMLIYSWFYSAGFRYQDGILSGLGYDGFKYWMEHHGKERIEGPFNFHIYVLGWYELAFLVAFLTHVVLFYRRASSEILLIAAAVVMFAMFALVLADPANFKDFFVYDLLKTYIWKPLKLKDNKDLFCSLILLAHAPLVTFQHLMRNERKLALTGYLFTATFFVYSYLGEKVPWLSMYPLIFGFPYLALFFEDYFTKYPIEYKRFRLSHAFMIVGCTLMVLGIVFALESYTRENLPNTFSDPSMKENTGFLAVGLLLATCGLLSVWEEYLGRFHLGMALSIAFVCFNIRATVQTNFLYAGEETEYLSQVHTTYELAEAAQHIIDTTLNERDNYRPKVLVKGEATWPLTWYFRHLKEEYKFSATPDETSQFTYVFQDWKDSPSPSDIPDGFYVRKLNLRGWWVPDFKAMTLKKFLSYSINHYPWSPSGFSHTTLLVNKNTAQFK